MFENWPVTQSSQHEQEEEANMATSGLKCEFCRLIFGIYALKSESRPDLGVCMYLDNVTRPVSELLGCSLVNLSCFVQGCQLNWIH